MKNYFLPILKVYYFRAFLVIFLRLLYKFMSCFFPIEKGLFFFESFDGRSVSDSPYELYKQLSGKVDAKFVWSSRQNPMHPNITIEDGVFFVKPNSLKYFCYLARSEYIISNSRMSYFFSKKSGQYYIQCWHGTPLKKIGCDIKKSTNSLVSNNAIDLAYKTEGKIVDVFISPSSYATSCFISSFALSEEKILELGYPRNDVLVNKSKDNSFIHTIKSRLGIPLSNRVILYAPTYRDYDVDSYGKYNFSNFLCSDDFCSSFSENVTLLIRGHYFTEAISNHRNFIDVSQYDNVADLYLISDALITDYSSVFFDFALLNRPIYFYLPDLEMYERNTRGFYLNVPDDLPGFSTSNPLALAKKILDDNFEAVDHSRFNNIYNPYEDGQSTKRCCDYLLKLGTED